LHRFALALAHDFGVGPRAEVLIHLAEVELLQWSLSDALTHAAEALLLVRHEASPLVIARACMTYGATLQASGLTSHAEPYYERALALLSAQDEPRLLAKLWAQRCQLAFHRDEHELAAAKQACERALVAAQRVEARYRHPIIATMHCNRVALALIEGDLATGEASLAAAAVLPNLHVRTRWLIRFNTALAAVRRHNDAASNAQLWALMDETVVPTRVFALDAYAVMAAVYTAMGARPQAIAALEALAADRSRALWAVLHGVDQSPEPARGRAHVLERLAVVAELRDDATGKHCHRVGRLACLLGMELGLPSQALPALEFSARLHDIGKFAIPDAILLHPGRLDDAQRRLMQTHVNIGAKFLAGANEGLLPDKDMAVTIARDHHEHWCGAGYPGACTGTDIPLPARITAVADVYDALRHERPYKKAWPHEDVMRYMVQQRGAQFEPAIIDALLRIVPTDADALRPFLQSLEPSPDDDTVSRIGSALLPET
jgi:HD-GYP domain-containing protein (c-di-GMP phosphodiesterase class II)